MNDKTRAAMRVLWDEWKKVAVQIMAGGAMLAAFWTQAKPAVEAISQTGQVTSEALANINQIPEVKEKVFYLDQKIESTTDHVIAPIWQADNQGRCVYANYSLAELYGGHPSQFESLEWLSFVHPQDQPSVYERWMKAVAQLTPYRDTYRLTNGKTVTVHGKPYKNLEGKVMFWAGTAREATHP